MVSLLLYRSMPYLRLHRVSYCVVCVSYRVSYCVSYCVYTVYISCYINTIEKEKQGYPIFLFYFYINYTTELHNKWKTDTRLSNNGSARRRRMAPENSPLRHIKVTRAR